MTPTTRRPINPPPAGPRARSRPLEGRIRDRDHRRVDRRGAGRRLRPVRGTVDRSAALRAGRTPVPRKVVLGIAVGFAVIGLGGVVLEHYFGNVGVATSVTTTTISTTGAPPAPLAPRAPLAPQIGAPLDAFLGLRQLGTAAGTRHPPAGAHRGAMEPERPDGQGRRPHLLQHRVHRHLPGARPRAQGCRRAARAEVRRRRVRRRQHRPEPHRGIPGPAGPDRRPACRRIRRSTSSPAPLRQLNTTWIDYGVTVTVGRTPTQETHNNILYFVDPQGRLRSSALPFANENRQGLYVLSRADIERFAQGIAQTAANLTTRPMTTPDDAPATPAPTPGAAPTGPTGVSGPDESVTWYKRTWVIVTAAIVVVIGASILIDLPRPISNAEDVASQTASLKEINTDVAPCGYAINETFLIHHDQVAGTLTSGRPPASATKMLTDDQTACSFTNSSIFDLTNNIQVQDTAAGKYVDRMLSVTTTWATSDALAAVEDIQYALPPPGGPRRRQRDLVHPGEAPGPRPGPGLLRHPAGRRAAAHPPRRTRTSRAARG